MFSHVGWSELVVLAVVGLVIFGPDRLPKAAADAVRAVRQLRTLARGAAADLKAELGPEIADLDLASLHPRRIVASVLDDNDEPAAAMPASRAPAMAPALGPGEQPPYDADAT
ncbi:MAG: twin-arginine translocase subunit TatB [Frankiaceae bacterium]|nr:twin-arginine translocase subunit TatB [Frankiaceae bacterium]MBV9369178.1 twin-arginine translocase subunit TatB [Frankiales bacterium]